LSPGPIRPCAALPWLPTATTLPPLWLLPGASRAPAPAGEIHGHAPAERRGCGGHSVASVLLNVHGDLRGLAFRKQPVFDKSIRFVKLIFLRPSVLSPSASIPLLEP
jgi:hypothetical protein